jgi:hypothetical protein
MLWQTVVSDKREDVTNLDNPEFILLAVAHALQSAERKGAKPDLSDVPLTDAVDELLKLEGLAPEGWRFCLGDKGAWYFEEVDLFTGRLVAADLAYSDERITLKPAGRALIVRLLSNCVRDDEKRASVERLSAAIGFDLTAFLSTGVPEESRSTVS